MMLDLHYARHTQLFIDSIIFNKILNRKKPWVIFSIPLVVVFNARICFCFILSAACDCASVNVRFFRICFFCCSDYQFCSLFIYFYLVLFVRLDSVNLLNVYDRTIIHGHTMFVANQVTLCFPTHDRCACDRIKFCNCRIRTYHNTLL